MDIITAITATICIALASQVFRCESPGEPPLFSDLPCPHGTPVHIEPAPLIQSVGTPFTGSLAETGAVDSGKHRASRSRDHRPARVSKAERCETARTGLRALQMKKRKGYSLAEAAQLEAEQREYKDTIRDTCR